MPTLRLYFLGTLDIRYDGHQLPKPATLKSQSLLAYLVLHRQRPQLRDRLAELFWGDRPESKARASLSTALWHIRRCLPEEGLIMSDPQAVQFDPQGDLWLDLDEFESHVSHGDIGHMQSGVALYRGDFLDGFYDEWVISERYRLETLFCEALARLMVGQEARGEYEAGLATALRLLDRDPLREDAHRLAMRAYCRLGQRNAALEQYLRCREMVLKELDVEPMVETTELYQDILEGQFPVERVAEAVVFEVPAFEPSMPPGRNPLDVMPACRLVGREEELALLQDCWLMAKAGQGRMALISGEAGVGKTRLVEEFASRLRWQGIRVLWGRSYEFERALPYQPVAEALRSVLPALSPSELADFPAWALGEVARLVPEMWEKLALGPEPSRRVEGRPGLEVMPPSPSNQEGTRVFEGLARFMAELSSHRALLIVFEDLHWASESTLGLVHYLIRHLTGHPVLMIGTFRPEAIGLEHPLMDLRRRLTRDGLASPLRLSCLSPADVEAMLMEMSGAGEAVVPLTRRVYQETEGNPFFVMEIVKALFETDAVCLEEGSWRGDFARISEGELPLPAGVSEAIRARVSRLNDDAQEALGLAAVLGREFDFDLLSAVWDRGEEATLEALDDLLRHHLVEEGSGAVGRDYAFAHHKIREVVYADIPRRRRQHTHARIGSVMERLYRCEEEALAGELAFHFEQGMQHDKALREKAINYRLQAGDQARRLYASHEAIDHYERALALLKAQGQQERAARTLLKLGLVYIAAFQPDKAQWAYEEAFALWEPLRESAETAEPQVAAAVLRFAVAEPLALDPGKIGEDISHFIAAQLFEGLVEIDPDYNVLPAVAVRWEVTDRGTRYLFHLGEGLRWSDGAPLTAGDFEYAWKRNLASRSPAAHLLYVIENARALGNGEISDPDKVGVTALDDLTLEVRLEEPTAYLPYLLAHPVAYPLPRWAVEGHGEAWTDPENLVSNGAYQLTEWQRGERLVLSRNSFYRGPFPGNAELVQCRVFTDFGPVLEAYAADALDAISMITSDPGTIARARAAYGDELLFTSQPSTFFLVFLADQPPFDDVRVRQALVHAVDREALVREASKGQYLPATGGFVPPGMPGHSPDIGLAYDPELARALLAQAGYAEGQGFPQVSWVHFGGLPGEPVVPFLRKAWGGNLGLSVEAESLEWVAFMERLRRDPAHLTLMGWLADYPDPDCFLRVLFHSTEGNNDPRWHNARFDALVEEAARVTDQTRRMELYGEADRILVAEEAVIMPLGYAQGRILVKPWVTIPRVPPVLMRLKQIVLQQEER